jgi:protein-tyrosine-phosphatase
MALPDRSRSDGSILFVCHGNIIRSALAEALLRHHVTSHRDGAPRVRSAGVSATPGTSADPRAIVAARRLGVALDAHRAQPLSRELVDDAAVIFAMDRVNEAHVGARFPDVRRKLRRLGAFARDPRDGDVIPDPFDLDAEAVMATAARIDRAAAALARQLAHDGRADVNASPERSR